MTHSAEQFRAGASPPGGAHAALGISLRTANRHWAYAKAWLYRHMSGRNGTGA